MFELSVDGTSVREKWNDQTLDCGHGGVVLVDGYLYGSTFDGIPKGDWICLDWDSGKVMYKAKWNGNKGSIVYADGILYCYDENTGDVALNDGTITIGTTGSVTDPNFLSFDATNASQGIFTVTAIAGSGYDISLLENVPVVGLTLDNFHINIDGGADEASEVQCPFKEFTELGQGFDIEQRVGGAGDQVIAGAAGLDLAVQPGRAKGGLAALGA